LTATHWSRELGDRARDGIVEADVEDAELAHGDRRALLDGELGDRLAQVAIVVHHLVDGEVVPPQLVPVPGGRFLRSGTRPRWRGRQAARA
jgi:hypothetical protein